MVGKVRGHSTAGQTGSGTGGRAAGPGLTLITQTHQVFPSLLACEISSSDKRAAHVTIGGTAVIGYSNCIRLVQASCSCMSLHMGPHPAMFSAVHLQYSLANSGEV